MQPAPARQSPLLAPRRPEPHGAALDPAALRRTARLYRSDLRSVLLRLGLLACAGLLWILPAL